MSHLRTGFNEHEIVLTSLLFALGSGNFPLVVQISFVAYQNDDDVVTALGAYIVDPFSGILEGLGV